MKRLPAEQPAPRKKGILGNKILLASCLFAWPLLYNYRLIIHGQDYSLLLGNDFSSLYYTYKI